MGAYQIRPLNLAVVAIVGAAIVWYALPSNQPGQSIIPPASADWTRQFTDLRDEGITNIGWIAGNAKGHPGWSMLRQHYGEDGDIYNGFIVLGTPGQAADTSAAINVSLYDQATEKGAAAKYDEAEETLRALRIAEVLKELTALMKSRQ